MERDEYDSFLFKDLKMALDMDSLDYGRNDGHFAALLPTEPKLEDRIVLEKKSKDLQLYYNRSNNNKAKNIKENIIHNIVDSQIQPTKDKQANKLKRYSRGMLPLPKMRHFFSNRIEPNISYQNQKKLPLKKEMIKQAQEELDKEELNLNNSTKLRHKIGNISKQQASNRRVINQPELKEQILNNKENILNKEQVKDTNIIKEINKVNLENKKLPHKLPFQLPEPIKRNLNIPNTPKLRHLKISEKEDEEEQVSKSILLKYIINNKPPYEAMSSNLNFLNLSPTLPPSKLIENDIIKEEEEEEDCSLYDQLSLDYLKFQTGCKNQIALNRIHQSLFILNNTKPINKVALNKKLEELKSLLLSMKCCCNCC